ncbi:hypothetical protein DPMN_066387 [Dreissena polymorpha]|uniref:Uncharacterized protein n=1 Tax=Dreissena polymorpha TaxID=45954 RepID=A0A9D3YTD6_DREPO|nr:hypothetical protein DPMN_066387 [Dreissena polymorpha]
MDATVLECFCPFNPMNIDSGGPTVMISHCVLVDCLQLFSSRLSHSQLDARSAAWLSLWIATCLSLPLPVVLTAVISLCKDWEQNPLTPTSTGNSQVRQPCCLHKSMSSVYFSFFLS